MNHAQEAIESIDAAKEQNNHQGAHLLLTHAQVHATLELAEQQRISNLIALYDMGASAPPIGIKSIDYAKIVVDITKALGLGDPK